MLAEKGVVSRFGVDFLACREHPADPWTLQALEINLRLLGTTHPFLALQLPDRRESRHRPRASSSRSAAGRSSIAPPTTSARSGTAPWSPRIVIDIVTDHRLHYNHRTESGVLFHLIGAVSEFGKLGVTAIANTPAEADALYERTLEVLDEETAYGR